MAFVAGKNSVFKLDNSGGSITDLSAYITDVSRTCASIGTARVPMGAHRWRCAFRDLQKSYLELPDSDDQPDSDTRHIPGGWKKKKLTLTQLYIVDCVVSERGSGDDKQYKVEWEGYGAEDTWEPAENIGASAPDAVSRYEAAKKLWEARYGERYQPPEVRAAHFSLSGTLIADMVVCTQWWYRGSDAERMFA